MTSQERVAQTLAFTIPDKVGIADDFDDGALRRWQESGGLPLGQAPEEYFDFDIRNFGFDETFRANEKNPITAARLDAPSLGENLKESYANARERNKFLTISCMDPFEHISQTVGRENLLTMMAEEANKASRLFADSLEFTLNMCQLIIDKGYGFDAAWLWGDLGCKKGLMFSTDYYNAFLFDLHKEFCDFSAKNGMPVILHSDGNIKELIPRLIEAGIRAVEPLDSEAGMDPAAIKRDYGKDIVLFGGIDERSFADGKKAEREISSKMKQLMKNGGYLYHAGSPILGNISFEDYVRVLELVKEYGRY